MMFFGERVGAVVNVILLCFVYVFGVGLTWFFSKLARKRFLDIEIDPNRESYWISLQKKSDPISRYYRQF